MGSCALIDRQTQLVKICNRGDTTVPRRRIATVILLYGFYPMPRECGVGVRVGQHSE